MKHIGIGFPDLLHYGQIVRTNARESCLNQKVMITKKKKKYEVANAFHDIYLEIIAMWAINIK